MTKSNQQKQLVRDIAFLRIKRDDLLQELEVLKATLLTGRRELDRRRAVARKRIKQNQIIKSICGD